MTLDRMTFAKPIGLIVTTWNSYRAGCACGWTSSTSSSRREIVDAQYETHLSTAHRGEPR